MNGKCSRSDGLHIADQWSITAQKFQAEVRQLDSDLAPLELTLETLRRTKLSESFQLQFEAQRELGEKLALLASYGQVLTRTLETDGFGDAYTGEEKTARVKAQLGEALESWSPATAYVPLPQVKEDGESYLGRADTL